MDSKERVKRTLKFLETDRVPMGLFGTAQTEMERLRRDLKAGSVEDLHKKLGLDIWHLASPLQYTGEQRFYKGKPADFWGVPLDAANDGDSSADSPLADVSSVDEVEAYRFPSVSDFTFDAYKWNKILDEHKDFALEGGLWAPIFHAVTWVCGFEAAMIKLVTEPEVMKALIRRITDFWIDCARAILDVSGGKIMLMHNCNDFGAQRGLIMSKNMFCEFFKPELKRLYDAIKEYAVVVMQHSCGAISDIFEDLIEIGADVINPIQVSADGMDIESLSRRFGGKVVMYGGIDTQHVLPEGPKEIIRAEVQRTLDCFQECGGLILAPSQGVESDISTEHLVTMFQEAHDLCRRKCKVIV